MNKQIKKGINQVNEESPKTLTQSMFIQEYQRFHVCELSPYQLCKHSFSFFSHEGLSLSFQSRAGSFKDREMSGLFQV